MLAIHLMFLASGAAALIFQVIWFKQLQLVLGSSTFAVSVTVGDAPTVSAVLTTSNTPVPSVQTNPT